MRHRRGVAFAEENKLQHVKQWVPFCPTKINVRNLPGLVANVEQERSNCVGHGGASGAQYSVISDLDAAHFSNIEQASAFTDAAVEFLTLRA